MWKLVPLNFSLWFVWAKFLIRYTLHRPSKSDDDCIIYNNFIAIESVLWVLSIRTLFPKEHANYLKLLSQQLNCSCHEKTPISLMSVSQLGTVGVQLMTQRPVMQCSIPQKDHSNVGTVSLSAAKTNATNIKKVWRMLPSIWERTFMILVKVIKSCITTIESFNLNTPPTQVNNWKTTDDWG